MPGMSGFEFLRQLRRPRQRPAHVPVIVWTVKDLSTEEPMRLRGLAQAVVAKGEGTQALLDELRSLLRAPGQARARDGR